MIIKNVNILNKNITYSKNRNTGAEPECYAPQEKTCARPFANMMSGSAKIVCGFPCFHMHTQQQKDHHDHQIFQYKSDHCLAPLQPCDLHWLFSGQLKRPCPLCQVGFVESAYPSWYSVPQEWAVTNDCSMTQACQSSHPSAAGLCSQGLKGHYWEFWQAEAIVSTFAYQKPIPSKNS